MSQPMPSGAIEGNPQSAKDFKVAKARNGVGKTSKELVRHACSRPRMASTPVKLQRPGRATVCSHSRQGRGRKHHRHHTKDFRRHEESVKGSRHQGCFTYANTAYPADESRCAQHFGILRGDKLHLLAACTFETNR